MSHGLRRPPRIARVLLHAALPSDVRDDVSGDLEEMFHHRRARDGRRRASWWYWQQSGAFAARFGAERLRERTRNADMRAGMSWIDLRLAVRMLVRYPGLTFVGVIGMACGIAIAAAAFAITHDLLDATLPLESGDRIVSIVNWDAATNNREQRTIHDFGTWRDQLDSVDDVGAFRTVGYNLFVPGTTPEPVSVAEMSAVGFRVAGVDPAMGRYFGPRDERPDAPKVVVLGDDVWRRRFGADTSIVGREIQLGDAFFSVIGVMPSGFAFPVNHSYWIPLRLDPRRFAPRSGPALYVFGRLKDGTSIERAQTELTAVSQRIASASPQTHAHLRARVLPYAYAFNDMDDPGNSIALQLTRTLIVMLLAIVSVNVAILVYARTATREGEIAVRTALGASRTRIVSQLFLEALVLAGAAAVVGLGVVAAGLTELDAVIVQLAGPMPFWMDFTLSPEAVIYVVGLSIFSAAIVGVVPAIKATGRRVHGPLQSLSAGSGSRMQMGRLWTLLIVGQVAVAVALLPATVFHTWNSLRPRSGDRGFASQEFITARVSADRPAEQRTPGTIPPAYGTSLMELARQLRNDPSVSGVTFSLANPGEEVAAVLEIEGTTPSERVDYNIVEGSRQGSLVRLNRVTPEFFETFGVPVLVGRGFQPADVRTDHVLVNRTFVDRLLGGANPLGRRVRYVGRSREAGEGNVDLNRWYEIVGVVPDFPAVSSPGETGGKLYHAVPPGAVYPAVVAIRIRGNSPSAFAQRLREISASAASTLQLRDVSTFAQTVEREQGMMRLIGFTLVGMTSSVLALSAAGIYALMSFTVARRRKEIGIRAALGADASQILAGIFSRAAGQLAAGAARGLLGAIGIERLLEGEMFQGHGAVILPIVVLIMSAVGMLAVWGPARNGLRIQPVEALREE
jgi:predicted permease